MEQRQISEQPQLLRQVSRNVAVVEVDPGDGPHLRVVQGGGAVNPSVIAHTGSDPVFGEFIRVGEDGLLPRLERHVSRPQPRVLEDEGRIYGDVLTPVTELIPVVEELPLADVVGLRVHEAAMWGDRGGGASDRRNEEAEEEEEAEYGGSRREQGAEMGNVLVPVPHLT